ncbi:MAG TPA: hypothetical protein VMT00_12385 [Thermoanaerobaculia bacterium]|nr:hypothetical protein [Thermoanaerobaculia bacterium]
MRHNTHTAADATSQTIGCVNGRATEREGRGDDDSVQVEPFDAMPLDLESLWE